MRLALGVIHIKPHSWLEKQYLIVWYLNINYKCVLICEMKNVVISSEAKDLQIYSPIWLWSFLNKNSFRLTVLRVLIIVHYVYDTYIALFWSEKYKLIFQNPFFNKTLKERVWKEIFNELS